MISLSWHKFPKKFITISFRLRIRNILYLVVIIAFWGITIGHFLSQNVNIASVQNRHSFPGHVSRIWRDVPSLPSKQNLVWNEKITECTVGKLFTKAQSRSSKLAGQCKFVRLSLWKLNDILQSLYNDCNDHSYVSWKKSIC